MKARLTLIIPVFFIFSCIPQKEVYTDYSYEGNFKTYKTYAFVNNYYEMGEINYGLIPAFEKYISQRLNAQGYEYSERSPDLLVNYKFYENGLDLQASNQPLLTRFIRTGADELFADGYDLHKQSLRKGAILISIYDNHKRTHIWQGYSKGRLSSHGEPDLRYIKASVNQIFNEYRVLANGFLASRN